MTYTADVKTDPYLTNIILTREHKFICFIIDNADESK